MSNKIKVEQLAQLMQLDLTDEEIKQFSREMPQTLTAIANLNELDTNKVKPTYQTTGISNRFLKEVTDERNLSEKQVFQNVKKSHQGFFRIAGLKYAK